MRSRVPVTNDTVRFGASLYHEYTFNTIMYPLKEEPMPYRKDNVAYMGKTIHYSG
jgi:argininosuccinate synthase